MVNHRPEVLTYLTRDPLKHIVSLKMLAAYTQIIQSYYITRGSFAGVLLLLPTHISFYDTITYPSTDYVVLITADDPSVTEYLVNYIPADCNLIFKFVTAQDRAVAEKHFSLKRVTSFLSYTSQPNANFTPSRAVIVSEYLDENLLPLYAENGYTPDVVQAYFAAGQAFSCAIYASHEPVSVCLAYQNYGQIWEIGGLYTLKTARRQGFARRVVEATLTTLLVNNYTPRYQLHEANEPSKRLAECIGLYKFLTIEHYLYVHPPTDQKGSIL